MILAVIILLVAVNGFYVAAELATVNAKRPRLAQLADEGDVRARKLLTLLEDPTRLATFTAVTQIGKAVASLALGFFAQDRLATWLEPQFAQLSAAGWFWLQAAIGLLVLLGLTLLHVWLGEMIPKMLGLQFAERLALLTLAPMHWSMVLLRPLFSVIQRGAHWLRWLLGVPTPPTQATTHSPEEIRLLVEESSAGGVLDREEHRLLINTLQLRQVVTRQVMIPRNRMLAAPVTLPLPELFTLLASSPYSRLPLYEETIDQIVGVIHLKDLLQLRYQPQSAAPDAKRALDVRQYMRKPLFIPDSLLIDAVITQMQRARNNVAMVVDEYGGIAGMVALEDLVEEIIGEFQDEFDAENPAFRLDSEHHLLVRGDVQLDDLRGYLAVDFAVADVDTVGGFVASVLGRIPKVADTVTVDDVLIRVEKMEQNRVAEISLQLPAERVGELARWRDD